MDALVSLIEEGRTYLILLPVYVVLLVGERIVHELSSERAWDERDGAANIAITVAMLGMDLLIGALLPVAVMALLYEHARLVTLEGGLGWLLAFLLHDLTWYVDHRIGHRVGLFWALHQVHHSSREFNMTVASRGFILDNSSLTRPLFYLLPIFGVSPLHYIAIRVLVSIWGIAQHTRLVPRLGWLDLIFATPSSHRVHHGIEPEYIDKNYGEVLMIWDHLFGSYQPEAQEPSYGITTPLETYNPLRIEVAGIAWLLARVRSAPRWSDKLRYLVKPPEWRHDHEPGEGTIGA